MTDEEYAGCMDRVFNSLEYQNVDKSLLTGEKFMYKHLNIGDQVAQVAGIIYPIPIDNYVKIVKGVKFYGRYMDDSYAIHESKEFLEELLQGIIAVAKELGITVNIRKTRICKLSSLWRLPSSAILPDRYGKGYSENQPEKADQHEKEDEEVGAYSHRKGV